MSNEDGEEESNSKDNSLVPSNSKSTRRAGGRVRSKKRLSKKKNDLVESPQNLLGWVKTIGVPFVALWILSQMFLGGESSSSNVYYYQSSVYQSSVYGPDGRVDTAKKQSVRTNIPGLVDGQGRESRLPVQNNNNDNAALDFERRADQAFDRQLDEEIESMMRMQRNFLNEFW